MQDKIEIKKEDLELLNLRLAETEAERERLQKEMLVLKSAMTQAGSTSLWSRGTVAAVSVLAVATLLYTGAFHDAQSHVKENYKLDISAMSGLGPGPGRIMRSEQPIVSTSKPATRADKKINHYARAKVATQKQWGPPLVMSDPAAKKTNVTFDPLVKELQENLMTLGFDLKEADGFKGARTRHAIAEFRALYLPETAEQQDDAELAVLLVIYANLARNDAARFGIDHGVVAAIRLSSVRTGVDFSYLMKLAATESNFKPRVKSATSSATGIYQFTHDTWLNTLQLHGAKYGPLADYVSQIEHYETVYGYQRPIVRDKSLYQHLLDLRKNPRISAMMAAETVRDNQQILVSSFDREPEQTDLYLTHFLGTDAAIAFLQSLEQSPDANSVELFPEAASSNHAIFHPQVCEPRTIDEVYTLFGEKFTTSRFDDHSTY